MAMPTGDFASAAMLRVLDAGLGGPAHAPDDAHVPLAAKRTLLERALRERGPVAVLEAGRAVRRFPKDPLLCALLAGGDAASVFERWGRLERYVHSRHRTSRRLRVMETCRVLRVRHVALAPNPPPHAGESLAVLGVLHALADWAGACDVRAWIGREPALPVADPAALAAACAAGPITRWRLAWREPNPIPAVPPAPVVPLQPDAAPAERFFALAAADPVRRWRVAEAAASLALPARTFQRALATAGTSFSALVARTRRETAAARLVNGTQALAEVGYLCGYADQAHFTREFTHATGLSPGRYRQEFARA